MRRLGLFSSSFHLRRPALAFVGCCGPSWAFVGVVRANYGCGGYEINCTFKKNLTYGPNDASSVVWALFHLCRPVLAFVGCCGPLLASSRPAMGMVGKK